LKDLRQLHWARWLPGLVVLREYRAEWLRNDIVAGVVLATMLVPVGIAYAVASGVPGIYGLYATIIPLLAYALFGPSRILVLGPDSALAPSRSPASSSSVGMRRCFSPMRSCSKTVFWR
jgi:MFS superfamily sulfate permease-like transporter